jgi:thiol:disulfide interchange protein DsbD
VTLLCAPLLAQSNGHLKVGEVPKVAGKRGAAVQAKIPLVVDSGFHVNSNAPNEEYLIPLKLTWKETGALQGGQVVYPKPAQEKYEFTEKPLSVFTGRFEVMANFKVAANAPAGPGVAAGQLRYQACNDKACFPPKTIDISLPYSVQ